MNNVKVSKADLLKVVIANRAAHAELYTEAIAGYRKKAVQALEKELKAARAGKKFSLVLRLTEPQSHVADYDRALAMLKMSVDDVIELTAENFQELVRDEWHWRGQFISSNSHYSSKIAKLAR